jgi:hypothetical protein
MRDVSTSEVVVIRRTFDFVFGWTATVLLTLLVLWAIFFSPPESDFWYVAQLIPVIWPVLWLSWLATVHPRLELSESGLGVTNWFYHYRIPWAAISWIQSGDQTVVHTVGGQRIKSAAGAWSLAGRARGNPVQSRIREQITEFQKNATGTDTEISRRLDVHPIPFLGVLVVFLALTAIVR